MTAGTLLRQRRASAWGSGLALVGAWILTGGVFRAEAAADAPLERNAAGALRPILECVAPNASGGYTAHFGYVNEGTTTVTVPVGDRNGVTRLDRHLLAAAIAPDRGQHPLPGGEA